MAEPLPQHQPSFSRSFNLASRLSHNLIVVGLNWDYYDTTVSSLSDSNSNTWTLIQTQAVVGAPAASLYYCLNPTVGPSHTFSSSSTAGNLFVVAVSGAISSNVLDQQNGSNSSGSSTSTGNVTTTYTNEFVVTVCGGFAYGFAPTIISGGSGFTIIDSYTTATSEPGSAAYKIETSIATENVTWNSSSSPYMCAIVASFIASGTIINVVNTWGFMEFF